MLFVQRFAFVGWMYRRGVGLCLMRRSFEVWIHCVRRVERRRVGEVSMVEWMCVMILDGV